MLMVLCFILRRYQVQILTINLAVLTCLYSSSHSTQDSDLDSYNTGQELVAGFCEHGSEHLDSVKGNEFLY
jgi:hypothetical protein